MGLGGTRLSTGYRTAFARSAAVLAAAMAITASVVTSSEAQQVGNLLDPLQQLQQLQSQAGRSAVSSGQLSAQETVLVPTSPSNPNLPVSRLERIMSDRAGVRLSLFGYDQLGIGRAVTLPQVGALQDDYVLGPGDEVVVTLRGQENSEYRVSVDRDGRIVIPRMNPVSAAGRRLGDVRTDLSNAVHRGYVSTEAFVTVGRVRQISVVVSGEVGSPGVRTLTGLSSPEDAILVSGGVKKTGSLRNVYILRGGRRISFDLYTLVTGSGRASRVLLTDGDRIVVPSLGNTVAVVGWVRRPAIYEIGAGRSSVTIRELLALSGGMEVRGKYRLSLLHASADGNNKMLPVENEGASVSDSDILFVQPAASQTDTSATLSGGTVLAGKYAAKNTTLSQLLKAPGALGRDPYTLFGIISRRDPKTLMRSLIPFTPVAVLNGKEDMAILADDIVRVISVNEARGLSAALVQFGSRLRYDEERLRNPQAAAGSRGAMSGVQAQEGTDYADAIGRANAAAFGSTATFSQERQPSANDQNLEFSDQQQLSGQPYGNQPYPAQPYSALGTQPYGAQPYTVQPYGQQAYPSQSGGLPYGAAGAGQMAIQQQNAQPQYGQSPLQAGSSTALGAGNLQTQPQSQPQTRPFDQAYTPNEQDSTGVPGQVPTNVEVRRVSDLAMQLRIDTLVLMNFLTDRSVTIDGAVQGPGVYLAGPGADIRSVLQAAGGFSVMADRSSVEISSTMLDVNNGLANSTRRTVSLAGNAPSDYVVLPHDNLRVSKVFSIANVGSVTLQGEVRRVGSFQIMRGDHLSDVLVRAGGLTKDAYPFGTVFLRKSAAGRERDAYRRQAQEIENQLLAATSRRDTAGKLAPEAFVSLQTFVEKLRNQPALGRIAITAEPAILAAHPDLDPVLEPGDVIYVPSRPFSIAVLGEVLQPGSMPFDPRKGIADYIEMAGGYSQFASKSQTVLVLPDGTARLWEPSWFDFSFNHEEIPPGSTIFIARDVSGVDAHQIVMDLTQIFSQLAVSAASLAVLSKQ
jgi:protein involved in polysaccharide export with SLBB domain